MFVGVLGKYTRMIHVDADRYDNWLWFVKLLSTSYNAVCSFHTRRICKYQKPKVERILIEKDISPSLRGAIREK